MLINPAPNKVHQQSMTGGVIVAKQFNVFTKRNP
jgi:hypothetical protein